MKQIIPIRKTEDIPAEYKDTPIGLLFAFHNLNLPRKAFSEAQLLIGMCMDHRKRLRIPENFAYILRTGGANLRQHEFQVAYAIAVGGVKAVAVIGHTQCGMVNLNARRTQYIQGLVEVTGWGNELAETHFIEQSPLNEIVDEAGFVVSEVKRLRSLFPNVVIAPLLYQVENHLLYLIGEESTP
jgi:carbonic anhydrase